MEESLQIRRFNEIPSPDEFASQIELKNVPAVFSGCVKNWKAFSKWNASNGGLNYLQDLVGSSVVEAMVSRSAPVFYGDIRSHERVPLPFSSFIGYCKDLLQYEDDSGDSICQLRKHKPSEISTQHGDCAMEGESLHQIYLAQVVGHRPISFTVFGSKLDCSVHLHGYSKVAELPWELGVFA